MRRIADASEPPVVVPVIVVPVDVHVPVVVPPVEGGVLYGPSSMTPPIESPGKPDSNLAEAYCQSSLG